MELPLAYTEKMKMLLGEGYDSYLDSFAQERVYGLRCNGLKINGTWLEAQELFGLTPVPWCGGGFYFDGTKRPAKHPYYHAGLYYLQEPSAMSPGEILPITPGDFVLDICAAPGGKSTQLGARLEGQGLLFANDISAGRVKALLKNIELFGIRNSIVLSESPKALAGRFEGFFHKILIDAPCSGEGMFRKEPDMIKSWDEKMLEFCRSSQKEILEQSAGMLRPGGMMLYSTCTFSKEENEDSIGTFLEEHPEFHLVPIAKAHGFEPGLGAFSYCARLYPHKIKGEGHFLALLEKDGDPSAPSHVPLVEGVSEADIVPYRTFEQEVLHTKLEGKFQIFGETLCYLPQGMPSVKGLRALRTGWQLGTLKKGRFVPSQAFAMGLRMKEVKRIINYDLTDEAVIRYLKGETLETTGEDGWTLVCVDSFPLGWGKSQGGRLKNKYAVGWKWE